MDIFFCHLPEKKFWNYERPFNPRFFCDAKFPAKRGLGRRISILRSTVKLRHPTTMRQFCIDLRLCLQQKDVIGKISYASHFLNDFFYWTKLNILLGRAILVLTKKYSNTIIGLNCNNSKYFSLKYDLIFNAQYSQWTYKDLDPHTQ